MKKLFGILGILLFIYFGINTVRSYGLYYFVKEYGFGWSTGMFQENDQYGFKLHAKNRGYQMTKQNTRITVLTGEWGNRVDSLSFINKSKDTPQFLFIGDSFVFGHRCIAEQSFPYLVGQKLNKSIVNTGVSSYGFSQMQMTLTDFLEHHSPEKVFIQYSPWLAERSANWYVDVLVGLIPIPYYYQENEKILIHPPVYQSKMIGPDVELFRGNGQSAGDFIKFIFNVSLPIFLPDDYNFIVTQLKFLFGILPKPLTDQVMIDKYVLNQMANACNEKGVKPIFLFMANDWGNNHSDLKDLLQDKAEIIDIDSALRSKLTEDTEAAYNRAYCFWGGENNEILEDTHPNPDAHQLMSEIVSLAIAPDSVVAEKQ